LIEGNQTFAEEIFDCCATADKFLQLCYIVDRRREEKTWALIGQIYHHHRYVNVKRFTSLRDFSSYLTYPKVFTVRHIPFDFVFILHIIAMALGNAAIDSEIATLEGKVKVMKRSESSLLLQLSTLRSSLKNNQDQIAQLLRNLRAPTASLPNEILSEVFKAGPSTPWDCLNHAMSVSQVTRRWRGVAISTPSIWAAIHIGLFSMRNWLKLMEVFLERSRETPLDIIIHFDKTFRSGGCPARCAPHCPSSSRVICASPGDVRSESAGGGTLLPPFQRTVFPAAPCF
jgi:hypothetical protein